MSNENMEFVFWSVSSDDVYDDEGDIVGTDDYALIERVWVPVEKRSKGIARKMMIEVIEEIKKAGHHTIKIAALPFDDGLDMETLVNFYDTLGFSVTNTEGASVIMSMEV